MDFSLPTGAVELPTSNRVIRRWVQLLDGREQQVTRGGQLLAWYPVPASHALMLGTEYWGAQIRGACGRPDDPGQRGDGVAVGLFIWSELSADHTGAFDAPSGILIARPQLGIDPAALVLMVELVPSESEALDLMRKVAREEAERRGKTLVRRVVHYEAV